MNGKGQPLGYKGDKYQGGYRLGETYTGTGEYVIGDNFKFEGDWGPEYEKHGKGRMTWASGNSYDGCWEEDKPHGEGTKKWASSNDKYEGEWVAGKQHGTGAYTWGTGATYRGEFRNGKRNGEGTKKRADGSLVFTGRWVNGDPENLGESTKAKN